LTKIEKENNKNPNKFSKNIKSINAFGFSNRDIRFEDFSQSKISNNKETKKISIISSKDKNTKNNIYIKDENNNNFKKNNNNNNTINVDNPNFISKSRYNRTNLDISNNFYENNLVLINKLNKEKNIKRLKSVDIRNLSKISFDNSKNEIMKNRIRDYFNKVKKSNHLVFENFLIFSVKEFFMNFICCKKLKSYRLVEKEKMFEKAEGKVYEYLDVLTYFKNLEDLEKLKFVLFNTSQKIAFDFSRTRSFSEIINQTNEEEILNSIDYFRKDNDQCDLCDLKLKSLFTHEFHYLVRNRF